MACKSFGRRLARTLAGMALVLGLPGASSPARPSARPSWWEIKLTVTVAGAEGTAACHVWFFVLAL